MQVELKNSKGRFRPFELKIKIESYNEAVTLWHRLNIKLAIFEDDQHYNGGRFKVQDGLKGDSYTLWNAIDKELTNQGY